MTNDPLVNAALARDLAVSADLLAQIELERGTRPVLLLLMRARQDGIAAMTSLVTANPADTKDIYRLQNEVKRFDDLIRWSLEVISLGEAADKAFSLDDQEAIKSLLSTPEGRREAAELGITTEDNDA
jgi:hypothetical protein